MPRLILLALVFSSCASYVPITVEMMEKSSLTPQDLKYVQFFMSRDTTFERKLRPSERDGGGDTGPIGLYVERILVDSKTPGIAEDVDVQPLPNERKKILLWISFEKGIRFPFVADGSGAFNLASQDRRIVIGEKVYDVSFEGPDRPRLLVMEDQGVEERTLDGRTVGE
jgi:hypothetical protein